MKTFVILGYSQFGDQSYMDTVQAESSAAAIVEVLSREEYQNWEVNEVIELD